MQAVRVNSTLSTWRHVKAGVVQGSRLGPLLFNAYFDAIIKDQTANGTISVKYADDLLLIRNVNSDIDQQELQKDVNNTHSHLNGAEGLTPK
jgi:hypothetical protein